MSNIIIKSIDSFDYDPISYIPSGIEDLAINLTVTIGVKDSSGGDNFDLFVCSPEWLLKNIWDPEIVRHTLIIRKYDIEEIKKIITTYMEKCKSNTWLETAEKLSRYFAWEFEDYKE